MVEEKKRKRYRFAEGKRWIEVRVKNPLQLFDARDPAPFRERDLDDDFVEYIVTSAQEFPLSSPLKILIHVGDPETKALSREAISDAIEGYLSYQIDLQRVALRAFLKRAQVFLVIGLLVLGLCLGLAQSISLGDSPGIRGILKEGIVIFGWVSIWKPIELILFDWYPLYEKLRFYKKLLKIEVEIQFSSPV